MRDVVQAINKMAGIRHPKLNHMANTRNLLQHFGYFSHLASIRLIHVAGTKGKGTTSFYTSNFLESYKYRVGLFTSPHLTDARERILVNNQKLSEEKFTFYFFDLLERIEAMRGSEDAGTRLMAESVGLFSFFFVLAIFIFLEEKIDVAVIETGIGGRFDTTNLIQPEISVITALGFDHMNILGDTIELIASQKAGIIKPNAVCFSFSQKDYPQTRAILQEEARRCNTDITFFDDRTFPLSEWPLLAIGGEHIVENTKVALLVARHFAARSMQEPLSDGELHVLRDLTFEGRSQVYRLFGTPFTFYLDGAHTPESIHYAAKWFTEAAVPGRSDSPPERILVFYTSRSPESVLKSFAPFVSFFSKAVIAQIYNPKPSADSPHPDDLGAWKSYATKVMEETMCVWRRLYPDCPCEGMAKRLETFADVEPFFTSDSPDGSEKHILVCGSFFLLADFLRGLEEVKAVTAPRT